ncbi:MAG: HD domain-containing protein [Desulfurococcales archaeon]|nr:HD domain-containing protein [Desulfurococcales archaeon]
MGDYTLIKDPVHGYVRVYPHERCLIDSPPFQRLRRLKQLSTTYLVYPGAMHTRFSHSLGVMHVAGVFAEHIYSKLDIPSGDVDRLVSIARLLGLLHDVGHGPFSHTFEDHVLVNYGTNHEVIGGRLVMEDPDLAGCFDKFIEKELGVSAKDMGKMIEAPTTEVWPLTSQISDGVSERSLYYIIKGPYSADLIDYLIRDSMYTGANYGIGLDWERLAYNSQVINDRLVLDYKAKDVLEHLLIARVFMFKTVYFHKTTRAFDKIAGEMLIKAQDILGFREAVEDVRKYQWLDDEYVLNHPEVRKLEEARYILNRKVPYKAVYQAVLPVDPNTKVFLSFSRRIIKEELESRLKSIANLGSDEDIVFVDTPKLPTNPMFEESIVQIMGPDGEVTEAPVRETVMGHMPSEIAFVRIYIKSKYSQHSEVLRSLASTVFKGSESRTFY